MNAVTMADLRRILVACAGESETPDATDIADVEFTELGYDSLALLETAARLEQEFGVAISDDRVAELATPAEFLSCVNALLDPAHRTRHTVIVNAPAATVYSLLADVTLAPALFAAPIYYRPTEHHDRFRVWMLAGGEVASWTSVRRPDPQRQVITFRQEQPHPLVAAMSGQFRMAERPDGSTEVTLDHEFVAANAEAVPFVEEVTDANSAAQLAALRNLAELPLGELLCTIEDSVEVRGSVADAYEFVRNVREWPNRLPHIGSVDVREAAGGVQYLTKRVVGGEPTMSVRLCFPQERIVFKQVTPPVGLLGNAGEWTFTPTATGCVITVRHTLLFDPAASARRDRIRDAVATSGRRTLLGAQRASA